MNEVFFEREVFSCVVDRNLNYGQPRQTIPSSFSIRLLGVYGPGLEDLELAVRDTADISSSKCSLSKTNEREINYPDSANVFRRTLRHTPLRLFLKNVHSK